jgi:D-glycero-D-manno-heptose 1,7-bisphosphate phosphatase
MNLNSLKIDNTWTLFLDRDGVINRRIIGGYVRTWDQFVFIDGVKEALNILSGMFGKIFVVSNQQGIGKGLMTENELQLVHSKMVETIEAAGGRIDRTYHSPFLETEKSILRKPNIGMALLARKEFPGTNFNYSVMVGDSVSDMVFGKKLDMITVFISEDKEFIGKNYQLIDLAFPDLLSFSKALSVQAG